MMLEDFLNQFITTFQEGSIASLGIALLTGIISSGVCPCTLPVGLSFAGNVSNASVRESKTGFFITFSFFMIGRQGNSTFDRRGFVLQDSSLVTGKSIPCINISGKNSDYCTSAKR
jgi:hypothetical protein